MIELRRTIVIHRVAGSKQLAVTLAIAGHNAFELARTTRDRTAAVALATEARPASTRFADAVDANGPTLAEVDRWLARR